MSYELACSVWCAGLTRQQILPLRRTITVGDIVSRGANHSTVIVSSNRNGGLLLHLLLIFSVWCVSFSQGEIIDPEHPAKKMSSEISYGLFAVIREYYFSFYSALSLVSL